MTATQKVRQELARASEAPRLQLAVKRAIDLVVGVPAFVVSFPLFGLIALLVKADSTGPLFYVGKRIGRNGTLFDCIKFRTMYVDNDELLQEHLTNNHGARKKWEVHKKLDDDPRVTRVGRLLRKTSLDELPQILNILRGEMSIVGPRPYLPRELDDVGEYAATILLMRPGMAGPWIARGRNRLTFQERLRLESAYVRNWSLKADMVVFWRSLWAVLAGRGAY